MGRRSFKCKATGKVAYLSQVDALAKAESASHWYGQRMRVYRCPKCSNWHTSRVKRADPGRPGPSR